MLTEKPPRARLIVFGILFWYPLAGVTYQFLHYLIGLRRLGYDPYYVEDSARYVYDPWLRDLSPDPTKNIQAVAPVLAAHGFADRWAFRSAYPGGECHGLTESELNRLYREADAFLNVTGAQEIREEHLRCPRRIYVESDPVASQIRVAQGDHEMIAALAAHDVHFTFGENLGAADCRVPTERFRWLPTRQPVVLDLWDTAGLPPGTTYTTIATWHNKGKDVTWQGERYYWSKDREFLKLIDLPRRCAAPIELALDASDDARELILANGWRQRDAGPISQDVHRYRGYVQGSRGEFTVAKDQYVRMRSGWFSDRSACYLAAGRPVITQDTGFGKVLPTGLGLFPFSNEEDILSAFSAIEADYQTHSQAARAIASDYFSAEVVLTRLMGQAGL